MTQNAIKSLRETHVESNQYKDSYWIEKKSLNNPFSINFVKKFFLNPLKTLF